MNAPIPFAASEINRVAAFKRSDGQDIPDRVLSHTYLTPKALSVANAVIDRKSHTATAIKIFIALLSVPNR